MWRVEFHIEFMQESNLVAWLTRSNTPLTIKSIYASIGNITLKVNELKRAGQFERAKQDLAYICCSGRVYVTPQALSTK